MPQLATPFHVMRSWVACGCMSIEDIDIHVLYNTLRRRLEHVYYSRKMLLDLLLVAS